MKDIRKRCNPMVDLLKFTSNKKLKKLLNKVWPIEMARVAKLIVLVTLFLLHVIVNFKHPNATTSCPSKKSIK